MNSATISIWEVLGIAETDDQRSIKRAYAKQFSGLQPDDLPADPSRECWPSFLANAAAHPRKALATLTASDTLLNFAVREQFEVDAARYCASAACSEELRDAVVEHFGWEKDIGHLLKLDSRAARDTLERYRADRSFGQFRAYARNNQALTCLMAYRHPKSSWRLGDARFARAIKEQVQLIQIRHREMLHYRLDATVFDWWGRRAYDKKYFIQTALYSVLAGIGLFIAAFLLLDRAGLLAQRRAIAAAFGASQAIGFGLFAALAFRQPERLFLQWDRFSDGWLGKWLHHDRYQDAWQFGWLLPFFGLSLFLFIPDPGPALRIVMGLAMLVCAAFALCAASSALGKWQYLFIALIAIAATCDMAGTNFAQFGFGTGLFCSIAIAALAMQPAERLHARLKLFGARRIQLRVGWLLGCAALYWALKADAMPGSMLALLTWSWCFAGILLARVAFFPHYPWIQLIALKLVLLTVPLYFKPLPEHHLLFFVDFIFVVISFMLINLARKTSG